MNGLIFPKEYVFFEGKRSYFLLTSRSLENAGNILIGSYKLGLEHISLHTATRCTFISSFFLILSFISNKQSFPPLWNVGSSNSFFFCFLRFCFQNHLGYMGDESSTPMWTKKPSWFVCRAEILVRLSHGLGGTGKTKLSVLPRARKSMDTAWQRQTILQRVKAFLK